MPSYSPVTAFVRGLRLLRTINELGSARLRQLHKLTGIPEPTVMRLLETLIVEGYVRRTGSDYVVTGKVLSLSNGYDAHQHLLDVATPHIKRLSLETGWPSDLAVFDHDAMLIVHTSREPGAFTITRKFGSRSPMLVTSIGRAYLAWADARERDEILARLEASDDPLDRLARDRAWVADVLEATRNRGFAVIDPTYVQDAYNSRIWGLGKPVVMDGRVVACLNVLVLNAVQDFATGSEKLLPFLEEAVSAISKDLIGQK